MTSDSIDYAVLQALVSADEATAEELAHQLGHEQHPVDMSLFKLDELGLVQTSPTATLGYPSCVPTRDGYAAVHSGASSIGEALGRLSAPAGTTNNFNMRDNYGNAAQGNYNTQNQTINVSISTGDLAPVLEAMRSHGDTKTADEIEKIHQAGDHPGVLRRLFERFSSKAVDAAADRAVDAALSPAYAAKILPMISDLAVSAFGGA